MDKLSELSKPVAYSLRFRNMNGEPDKTINANTTFSTLEKAKAYGLGSRYVTQGDGKIVSVRDPSQDPIVEPLYSQEYVSALLTRIEELEKKDQWSERQSVIDGLAGAGEAWSDIEEYMVKWDEEHRKAIGKQPVRYQCREIGEGGWMDCDKDRYDYCQRRPEMDTRTVSSPLAELEAKDKRIAELEAKLATPVRLPTEHELHQVSCSECAGNCLELVENTVRAAGFKVKGDA
ncbi:hypothetical protein [Serratia marcescens]|uniref:hypothetical protein n=1 Tax=Serratia marcescens TaxID=615 RepID=UPI00198027E0|nr:hypothetical protein [Serratia marcescens]MBN3977348.1 hypothetical protein [Serratia marcescens]